MFYASAKRLAVNTVLDVETKLSYLRLARSENVGPIGFFHLIEKFKHPEEALGRLSKQPTYKGRICSFDESRREFEMHKERGYHLVCYFDPEYPENLRELKDPPVFLSVSGNLSMLKTRCFAVVGGRNASQSAYAWIKKYVPEFREFSETITSGLARGVDAWAHETAVESGLSTIAVIAGGLGHIYPPEHKDLYHRIEARGAVISEDPLLVSPHAQLFPKRNRIISGLSWGILIIEASFKSGALLSAKYALDQNRSIFVLPGHPLDPRSRGGNRLIRDGACLTEDAQDIRKEYPDRMLQKSFVAQESEGDDYVSVRANFFENIGQSEASNFSIIQRILEKLSLIPVNVEELSHMLNISSICVRSALVEMELQGLIHLYPGDAIILNAHKGE